MNLGTIDGGFPGCVIKVIINPGETVLEGGHRPVDHHTHHVMHNLVSVKIVIAMDKCDLQQHRKGHKGGDQATIPTLPHPHWQKWTSQPIPVNM